MVETHEYIGWWWLPEDDSVQLPGTLTITKGEASLELLGNFGRDVISQTETEIELSAGLAERKRIVGFTSEGKEITLAGHRSADYVEHFPGLSVATYTRYVTLVGKQFRKRERIAFDEIAITASDLHTWTQKTSFSTLHLPKTLGIKFSVPNNINIPLARGARAFIRFTGESKGSTSARKMALTQDAVFHLRLPRPMSIDDVFERAGQIRNFLSFAVGRPITITSVTGFQDNYLDERTNKPIPIQMLWGIAHNPDLPEGARRPHDMFFTLPDASPDISTVLKSWLSKQKRLKPIFNLYFGMRYHPDMYSDVKFLMYAQAVETYGYRRRRKVVDRTFADQVRDVLGNCRTVSRKIVGPTAADEAAFIKLLTLSRNYYTHYDPKKEKKAAKGGALALLTMQLQALIEMSLLRELGFTVSAIDKTLVRVNRYAEIAGLRQYVAEGDTSPW